MLKHSGTFVPAKWVIVHVRMNGVCTYWYWTFRCILCRHNSCSCTSWRACVLALSFASGILQPRVALSYTQPQDLTHGCVYVLLRMCFPRRESLIFLVSYYIMGTRVLLLHWDPTISSWCQITAYHKVLIKPTQGESPLGSRVVHNFPSEGSKQCSIGLGLPIHFTQIWTSLIPSTVPLYTPKFDGLQ